MFPSIQDSRLVLLLVSIDLTVIKPAHWQNKALILWTVLSRASLCSLFSSRWLYLRESRLFFFLLFSSCSFTVSTVSMKTIRTLRLECNVGDWKCLNDWRLDSWSNRLIMDKFENFQRIWIHHFKNKWISTLGGILLIYLHKYFYIKSNNIWKEKIYLCVRR